MFAVRKCSGTPRQAWVHSKPGLWPSGSFGAAVMSYCQPDGSCGTNARPACEEDRPPTECLPCPAGEFLDFSATPPQCSSCPAGTRSLTRDRFDSLTKDLLDRTRAPILRVLRDTDTAREDLEGVILVGGASRTRSLHVLTEDLLERKPGYSRDPDLIVAEGAAVQQAAPTPPGELDPFDAFMATLDDLQKTNDAKIIHITE